MIEQDLGQRYPCAAVCAMGYSDTLYPVLMRVERIKKSNLANDQIISLLRLYTHEVLRRNCNTHAAH